MSKPHLYNTSSCHTVHTLAANGTSRQWKPKPRRTDLSALLCVSTHYVKVQVQFCYVATFVLNYKFWVLWYISVSCESLKFKILYYQLKKKIKHSVLIFRKLWWPLFPFCFCWFSTKLFFAQSFRMKLIIAIPQVLTSMQIYYHQNC